ncbi:MAG: helix-turn-helix transcriptional regulator [Ekhidna sp.]|nr:helix-turn-helix transcriptional regulator [Ekhidna sp.]MBC6427551.1 helix-turn-helix transcriptional regulator [Ekhidna sp.]
MQTQTNEYYLEAVNRAIEFIESNVEKDIKLEDISAYSHLSKYHFHRIFKFIIGNTIKDYIIRIRLEKSALLLKNTDKNIIDIAFDCGYSSPETFN